MRLFEYDAYASLTRFIPRDEPVVVIDVGANEGQTVRRVLSVFPRATVHAFEPAPETFALLENAVAGIGHASPGQVHAYPLACGEREGSVDFHLTRNHWCSSVLAPSELGKRYYGEWYQTKGVVTVGMTSLDAWARREGVERVDVLKVDAQGYDLQVLRGATGMLASGVRAVNCECQFAPEYEGGASFSQVDQFLASRGYVLHQLHEVHTKGDEEQTSYGDGLWLRSDVLASLRARTNLPDLTPTGRVRTALRRAKELGCTRAALYGSGRHTRGIASALAEMPLPVEAIIDDAPGMAGTTLEGVPIMSAESALALGVDVLVLSSDAHERAMWDKTEGLRRAGLLVLALYHPELVQHTGADRAPAGAG